MAGCKHEGMNAEKHTLKGCMDTSPARFACIPNPYVPCIACSHLHANIHKCIHNIHKSSEKLCLCRSHIFVPNGHIEHPAFHSRQHIHKVWEHPTVSGCSFTECVLPQETLTQPHRDKDHENSRNNLKSLSRSHFNSQKSAELDSISPSLTRAGALPASV